MGVSARTFILALMTTAAAVVGGAAAQEPTIVDEIVVRGVNIPDEKRATSEISAVLDRADFQVQGDFDAAEALRRVTGLSLVRGKYVYVRGLGDRYSSALLNGSPLPSPEPLSRVVPLDLFPTSTLSGALVQKTYSPQYPGDFGGGLIELRTRAVPDETYFQIGLETSADTATTFQNGLLYDGGGRDWLGFDDGTRNFPAPLAAAFARGQRITTLNFADDELEAIGDSFVNTPLWVITENTVPQNFGLDIEFGTSREFGDVTLGLIAAGGYDNSWQTKEGLQQTADFGAGALTIQNDFSFASTQNDVTIYGLVGIGAEIGSAHEIKLTNLYIHASTKEARVQQGFSFTDGQPIRRDYLQWFERQLNWSQIEGSSVFGDLALDWRAAYAESFRDSPYERFVQYESLDGGATFQYDDNQGRNLTTFSKVEDRQYGGGLNLGYSLDVFQSLVLKAGFDYSKTERNSQQRDFRFVEAGALSPEQLRSRIDFILDPSNIDPLLLVLQEVTGGFADPIYDGDLEIKAGFGGVDVELTPYLRIAAGARYEDSTQIVDSTGFYPEDRNAIVESTIQSDYILPAATATWTFADDLQLRLGYSQTIGRPQFRELSAAQFTDVETDRIFFGNPFLRNTEFRNYDARLEYYFGREQYVTIGGFYKSIRNPVEESVVTQGDTVIFTFVNAPKATLFGAEFEFEKRFELSEWKLGDGFLGAFAADKVLLFKTNYTYSQSELAIDPADTVIQRNGTVLPADQILDDGRPLQGQSKHLANLQIGYTNVETGAKATLLFNFASKRIRTVGLEALPDQIEAPPVTLDYTYIRPIEIGGRDLELSFAVSNILGEDQETFQAVGGNRADIDTYGLGRTLSVGIKHKF